MLGFHSLIFTWNPSFKCSWMNAVLGFHSSIFTWNHLSKFMNEVLGFHVRTPQVMNEVLGFHNLMFTWNPSSKSSWMRCWGSIIGSLHNVCWTSPVGETRMCYTHYKRHWDVYKRKQSVLSASSIDCGVTRSSGWHGLENAWLGGCVVGSWLAFVDLSVYWELVCVWHSMILQRSWNQSGGSNLYCGVLFALFVIWCVTCGNAWGAWLRRILVGSWLLFCTH